MYFHWQNLNEQAGGAKGPATQGRAWIRSERTRLAAGCEWHLLTSFWHAYIEFGGYSDADVTVSLACGLLAVWLHFEGLPWRRLMRALDGREIKLSLHDGGVWWVLWKDDSSWSSTTPRWRQGCWHPLDTFLGRWDYSSRPTQFERVRIPLPEGVLDGEVKMELATWKRPRWPWPRTMLRATITPDRAAVVPGKGENSWDMGDDAIFSLTCPAKTPSEAVTAYIGAVLREREKHGGRHYEPPEPWPNPHAA